MLLVLTVLVVLLTRNGESPQLMSVREQLARLAPVSDSVQNVQLSLAELRAHVAARDELERRTADSIRRLEMVIAGTQSRGAAGENILEVVFGTLPAEWQVRNLRVGDKHVEFGLRLPNNLVLPIDSKWTGVALIEQFGRCTDDLERRRVKAQIEATVLERARDLRKYVDPKLTVGFGLAALPDAVYDLCLGVQCDAFRENVVLVPYSMFVPYLMLVFQTAIKMSQNMDLHQLNAQLDSVENSVRLVQEEINGRFSRAITMLTNSRDDVGAHMSRATGAITSLRLSAPPASDEASALVAPSIRAM
jgi:DNA recombination protein RmuC